MNFNRQARLKKLEAGTTVGVCDQPTYLRVRHAFGEPAMAPTVNVPACRRCGEHHVVVLRERVVTKKEQLQSG
jgi:hypothetical protein